MDVCSIKNTSLLDSDTVPPVAEGDRFFEEHSQRKGAAARAFIRADARPLLKLAKHARGRRLQNPQPGDTVYYFRRGKGRGNNKGTYYGPARVLVCEPPLRPDGKTTSVVWIVHGQTLIRAAPEHLQIATKLESTLEQGMNGDTSQYIQQNLRNARSGSYVDLGRAPTEEETIEASQDMPAAGPYMEAGSSEPSEAPPVSAPPHVLPEETVPAPVVEPEPMDVEPSGRTTPPAVPEPTVETPARPTTRGLATPNGNSTAPEPEREASETPMAPPPEPAGSSSTSTSNSTSTSSSSAGSHAYAYLAQGGTLKDKSSEQSSQIPGCPGIFSDSVQRSL